MKTNAEKSSSTPSKTTAHNSARAPFFPKTGGGDFFAPAKTCSDTGIQAKLAVNSPGDMFEQEADRIADRVMRMPAPLSSAEEKTREPIDAGSRNTSSTPEEKIVPHSPREEKLQRRESNSSPSVSTGVQSAIQNPSTGQPLSGNVQGYMEQRLGADFSGVRVHHDSESETLSDQLNAQAFTHKNHVYFSKDQYQPDTSAGKQLLAHELVHTIQQGHASPAPQRLIQRQPPKGADTGTLDALIARVSAECDAFAHYKKSPLDGRSMPGSSIQLAVSRWDGGEKEPWMKDHVREKMGPLRMKLLNEMIAMSGVGWPDYETLFDVSFQRPGHQYKMQLKAAKTLSEKAITKLVPIATISYTNSLGWAWKRDYTLAALEIHAGVSAKKKGKKVKPGGGLGGGFISLDVTGSASANPTPIRYSGGNDFTGAVTILKTSAKAHLGPAGGALPGLTAVVFHGTAFGDVSFPFFTPLKGSVSGKDKDAGVDVSIGMGLGKSIGMGETEVTPPPKLKEVKQLDKSYREWGAIIGPFDTGRAYVTPQAANHLDELHKYVYAFKSDKLDPQAQDLRDQSVDPDKNFPLDFEVVGMASRSWATARSNAERLKKNEQLSLQRAGAVETEIHNRFSDVHEVRKSGTGSHAIGPWEAGHAQMLDDSEAQKIYESKRAEAMKIKNPQERRIVLEGIEANYGPQSDQLGARRVYVFCRWEGFMIMKTLVPDV